MQDQKSSSSVTVNLFLVHSACLLALEVGSEKRVVVGVGDNLGLDGLNVAGVRRRRGRGLLRLDARVEEAASVGQLQHRITATTVGAAVPGGRRRVQGERQARARRRREDGAEGGAPWVVVLLAVAAGADSKVVGDLFHASGRISRDVLVQRSSSAHTAPELLRKRGWFGAEVKFLGGEKEEKGFGGGKEDAWSLALSLAKLSLENGGVTQEGKRLEANAVCLWGRTVQSSWGASFLGQIKRLEWL